VTRVKTHAPENRRHFRCAGESPIIYSYLNRTERYAGLARNLSRSGMYFEGTKALPPGAFVVIQPSVRVQPGVPAPSPESGHPVPALGLGARCCPEHKALVMAQVKRCLRLEGEPFRFGIGVQYTSPAV
jgi:hypothetical protein